MNVNLTWNYTRISSMDKQSHSHNLWRYIDLMLEHSPAEDHDGNISSSDWALIQWYITSEGRMLTVN